MQIMKVTVNILLTVSLLILFTASAIAIRNPNINNYAVYYGVTEMENLKEFDMCIVQPTLPADILSALNSQGKYPIAYVSLGEAAPGDQAVFELPKSDLAGENPLWGSTKIKATSKKWRNIVLERIKLLIKSGFRGIFMDTVGDNPAGNKAMADFIRQIRISFPNIILIQNGALDMLDLTAPYIDFVLWEGFPTDYDFTIGTYRRIFTDEGLINKVKQITSQFGIKVLALAYAAPYDIELRDYARSVARHYGFIPYVSSLFLNKLYTPAVEKAYAKAMKEEFSSDNVLPIDVGGIGDKDTSYPSYVYGDWSSSKAHGPYSYREARTGWNSLVVLTLRKKENTEVYFLYKDEPSGLPSGQIFLQKGNINGATERILLAGLPFTFSNEFKIHSVKICAVDIEDAVSSKDGIQVVLGFRGCKIAQVGSRSDIMLARELFSRSATKTQTASQIVIPNKPGIATLSIHHTSVPPKIDGSMEPLWEHGFVAHLDGEDIGYKPECWQGPTDLSSDVYALWNKNALYLFFRVIDDKIRQQEKGYLMWKGDHIEVWFDTQLAADYKVRMPNTDDYQIGLSPGNFTAIGPEAVIWTPSVAQPAAQKIKVMAVKTSSGYDLEAAIPWEVLQINPEPSLVIGGAFTVSDTDSDSPIQETMISTSRESPGHWGDTHYFNNVKLSD